MAEPGSLLYGNGVPAINLDQRNDYPVRLG
jgi:hypothetical protein